MSSHCDEVVIGAELGLEYASCETTSILVFTTMEVGTGSYSSSSGDNPQGDDGTDPGRE